MAADLGKAELEFRARLDRLDNDMAQAKSKVSRATDDMGDDVHRRLGSKLSGIGGTIGKSLAFGIAGAAAGVGALLVSSVSGASDLAETVSKSNTIFGAQGAAMEKWASTAATSMGQSKKGALDAAATFGNLFVQLGTGSGEAAKMSQEMVGLASDFASFHNAAPTDVLEAMTAAFRGEYDAVQRYVPTISAATVEQQALKMGLAGSTKELTAQDKALATQALLLSGAGDAMGDFARTSDGLANRQRILTARFTDMKDKLGTAVLPVVLTVMTALMNFGEKVGPSIGRAFSSIREVVGFIGPAFKSAFSGEGITSDGLVGVAERVGVAFRAIVGWVRENWPQIKLIITETLETVKSVVVGFVDVVMTIWRNFGPQITAVVSAAWDFVKSTIQAALDTIQGIVKVITGIIHGDWSQVWEGIKQILGAAWDFIVARIEFAIEFVKSILSIGWELIKAAASAAWDGIKSLLAEAWEGIKSKISEGIDAVVGFVTELPGKIIGALGDVGNMLLDAGRKIMEGLLNGIKAGLGAVKDFVGGIAGKIISWKGPLSYDKTILVPAGRAIMDSLVTGLRDHEAQLVRQLAHVTGLVESVGSDPLGLAAGSYGASLNVSSMGHSGGGDAGGSGGSSTPARPINVGPFYVKEGDLPTEIPRRLRGALHLWDR